MSKRQVLMILGVWVMILPFLGFPSSWEEIIAVVSGVCIVAVAYSLMPSTLKLDPDPRITHVEHKSAAATPIVDAPEEPSVPITNDNPSNN